MKQQPSKQVVAGITHPVQKLAYINAKETSSLSGKGEDGVFTLDGGELWMKIHASDRKQLDISMGNFLSQMGPEDLKCFIIASFNDLLNRGERGNEAAKLSHFYMLAYFRHYLRQAEYTDPEYHANIVIAEKRFFPEETRRIRGKSWDSMSNTSKIAYWLHHIVSSCRRVGQISLPLLSKATYKEWLPAVRGVFEAEYGKDFENLPMFSHYWMNGQERRERAAVRDAIWKDIKQSIETIAADRSGTKGG